MRLWHKDLISVLPRKQLVSQWRECCAIAGEIGKYGSPRSPLTKKIMDYPIEHFECYTNMIVNELKKRGYNIHEEKFTKYFPLYILDYYYTFKDWHNNRYLKQCYYNLQEKYDCGAITTEDWIKIHATVMEVL